MKQTEKTATNQSIQNTFYLCEKPSQARSLAKALGAIKGRDQMHFAPGVVIGHGYGHMLTLAKPEAYIGNGKWRLDNLPILPKEWEWQVKEEHREHFNNLGKYISQADMVALATDPDEEGEVIGRQILEAHKYLGKVARLWVSALTQESLKNSLQNLQPISATDHLYHAGRVRHQIDWLYGMNLTRAFSVILNEQAKIGRVKTRLLKEIVNHDQQSQNNRQDGYETAYLMLGETMFELQLPDEPHDYKVDFNKLEGLQNGIYQNDECCGLSDEGMPFKFQTPLPYSLSALLADAADQGIPLDEGYRAVQKLYESGVISYPRTSSTQLPGTSNDFAVHHAIITMTDGLSSGMTEAAVRIFELIRLNELFQKNRLIHIDRSQTVEIGGEFFTSRTNWMTIPADSQDRTLPENQHILTNLRKKSAHKTGDMVQVNVRRTRENYANPLHFTEATLLHFMAKNGIGTEATRVAAIASLVKEKLIEVIPQTEHDGVPFKRSRTVRSTILGRKLINKLPESVTGNSMEFKLQEILKNVRSGNPDMAEHLIRTSEWLAKIIHDAAL
jgi:DNA topoisomerase-3